MGLLSFFNKRKDTSAPTPAAEAVAQARTKARQRLIGAVVLLGAGIIGFPLLFETQPRPIPVNIPIEIPRKEGAAPLATPPARQQAKADSSQRSKAAPVVIETPDEAPAAGNDTTAKVADASQAKAQATAAKASAAPAAPAKATNVAPKLAAESTKTPTTVADGRFVVQVGAFTETATARETRVKVEKLGLKTYTQVVDTSSGKRIRVRVGPFANRDQAVQAAEKIKAAGLQSSVLTL